MAKNKIVRLEDIFVKEVKCIWKTGLTEKERVYFIKQAVERPYQQCIYCNGHKVSCPNYIRRMTHYIGKLK